MTLFFFVLYVLIILWLFYGYSQALKISKQHPVKEDEFSKFSVLIAARNEEKSLPQLLTSLKNQETDWKKGTIILVLDRCFDNSLTIAKEFTREMPYLKIIELSKEPTNISPKKAALIAGLNEITSPIVLQTDADVILPSGWISSHLALHSKNNAAIIGLFNFSLPDNLWGKWLLSEKLLAFFIAISSYGWNIPFLAFGANISFDTTKIKYREQLKKFLHSLSGDDDLIIQTLKKNSQKAAFITNFSQLPKTSLPDNLSVFFKQRKRHLSAGHHFSLPAKWFYGLFTGSWSFFLFTLPFYPEYWYLFIFKIIIDYFALFHIGKTFPQKFSIIHIIILEIFYVPYLWITGAMAQLQKITWK